MRRELKYIFFFRGSLWWNKIFTKIMLKYVLHKRELVSIYSTVCRYYIYRQFYPYLVKYKPCFKQWHPSISPFWFQLLFWFQVGNSNNAACYDFKLRKICIEHAKFTNSIESYLWNWQKRLNKYRLYFLTFSPLDALQFWFSLKTALSWMCISITT